MRSRSTALLLALAGLCACFEGGRDDDDVGEETGGEPVCGDGIVDGEAGEECDDGNGVDGDACTNACTLAVCGDGVVQTGAEQCDDGNTADEDGCSAECMLESCGDGVVQPGEPCDDGNADDTDACTSMCQVAACGDGFVRAGVEACDDGNADDNDACLSTCEPASCGDGFTQAGVEQCDDADADDTDACLSTCMAAACGDGVVHFGFEACDDGNLESNDGCSSECLIDCGTDCFGEAGCLTEDGRCVRFTCRPAEGVGGDFCDSCLGWEEVTYQQWLGDGYCADVSAKYRMDYGYATACASAPSCCADQAACAGSDNAWHFWDGTQTKFVGPCLGCMDPDNCTYWDDVASGDYTRLGVCERLL